MLSLQRRSLAAVGAFALIAVGIAALLWTRGARESSSGVAPEATEAARGTEARRAPTDALVFAESGEPLDSAFAPAAERVAVERTLGTEDDATKARFLVLDARTGEPVERFGLRLSAADPNESAPEGPFRGAYRSRLFVQSHPGGTCVVAAAAQSVGYQVTARGYASQEGWVTDAARDGGRQTIRLEAGSTVTGRVVLGDEPYPDARLMLRRETLASSKYDVSAFASPIWAERSASDGSFRVDDLAAGTYEIEARSEGGAPKVIRGLRVAAGATLDLGVVALVELPTVRGLVVTPRGTSPEGLEVSAACGGRRRSAVCTADGRFTIDTLPPGSWSMAVPARAGVIVDGAPFEFTIAEGEDRDVVLDVSDRGGSWLAVSVRANGAPLEGAAVDVEALAEPDQIVTPGRTHDGGVARIWGRPVGRVEVVVRSHLGLPLVRVLHDWLPTPSGSSELAVEVDPAMLAVSWAGATVPLDSDVVILTVQSISDDGMYGTYGDELHSEAARERRAEQRVDRNRAECGTIAPGEYTISLLLGDSRARDLESAVAFQGTVVCRAREFAECTITDANRVPPQQVVGAMFQHTVDRIERTTRALEDTTGDR